MHGPPIKPGDLTEDRAPGGTVLLAERDDLHRMTLEFELNAAGYHVVSVEDGLEFNDYLELVEVTGGRIPPPDVIVSNVDLEGVGGLELCRTLALSQPTLPFILLAPETNLIPWLRAAAAGAAEVLRDDVGPEELLRAIASFLLPTRLRH